MIGFVEVLTGIVAGLGAIAAVFWFTFRDPPRRRTIDDTNAMNPNAEYLARSLRHDGHGGFF